MEMNGMNLVMKKSMNVLLLNLIMIQTVRINQRFPNHQGRRRRYGVPPPVVSYFDLQFAYVFQIMDRGTYSNEERINSEGDESEEDKDNSLPPLISERPCFI